MTSSPTRFVPQHAACPLQEFNHSAIAEYANISITPSTSTPLLGAHVQEEINNLSSVVTNAGQHCTIPSADRNIPSANQEGMDNANPVPMASARESFLCHADEVAIVTPAVETPAASDASTESPPSSNPQLSSDTIRTQQYITAPIRDETEANFRNIGMSVLRELRRERQIEETMVCAASASVPDRIARMEAVVSGNARAQGQDVEEGTGESQTGGDVGIASDSQRVGNTSNVSNPYMAYAYQSRLALPVPSSQQTNVPVVPTFHSPWAGVQPQPTRPRREIAKAVKKPRDHYQLLTSRLSGVHEWFFLPTNRMSYMYYVSSDRDDIRSDLARFKMLAMQDPPTAEEAWSMFAQIRYWFLIPGTPKCDRTFARDAFDCYYLDAIDKAFSAEAETPATECPLFQDCVLDRWWNAFGHKPDFLFEEYIRRTVRVLMSYDSYETVHYTNAELQQTFPALPFWMQELVYPAGIPLPLAPVAYYFPSDLRPGEDQRRHIRASKFLKWEVLGLLIAFWWNEMHFSGRQHVVPPATVNLLRHECLELNVVHGVPTSDILNMMDGSRVRDPTYWNSFKFGSSSIRDSYFVQCEKGSGDYLPGMKGGQVQLLEMRSRRVRMVLRQHHRMHVRKSSPLGLELQVRDLLRIPGLEAYVKRETWLQRDAVTVQDLLQKLFTRLIKEEDALKENRKMLQDVEFDRNGIRAALAQAESELIDAKRTSHNVPSRQTGLLPPPRHPFNALPSSNHSLREPDPLPPVPRRPPLTLCFHGKRDLDDYTRWQPQDSEFAYRRGNPRYRREDADGSAARWA